MLEYITNPIKATKRFVVKHKVAIAVAGTASFMLYLNVMMENQHNEFLKEHDLIGEFAKYLVEKK